MPLSATPTPDAKPWQFSPVEACTLMGNLDKYSTCTLRCAPHLTDSLSRRIAALGHWPEAVVNRFQRPSAGRGLSAYPSRGDGGLPAKFRAHNQERSRFHQPRCSVNHHARLPPLQKKARQQKPAGRSEERRVGKESRA